MELLRRMYEEDKKSDVYVLVNEFWAMAGRFPNIENIIRATTFWYQRNLPRNQTINLGYALELEL